MTDKQVQFDVLGNALDVAGPAEVVDPIAFAYRRFAVDRSTDAAVRIELRADDDTLVVASRETAIVPGLDRTGQVYQAVQVSLMDRIASHLVLHAAAMIEPRGGVVLLAAPSGHGKTSVALELVARGWRFMSDDYAPLDPATGTIAPYPRAVGLIPDGTAPIPEPFRAASRDPAGPKLLGKTLVDVGFVLGEPVVARDPAPLRHVILLTSNLDAPLEAPKTTVVLAARREHAPEMETVFRETPGVAMHSREERDPLVVWRLGLDHAARPTQRFASVLDGDRVVFFEKHWEDRPDFSAEPEARPIARRETAEFLGRELLNRRTAGALMARYGASVPRMFLDLAGALREAECWKVRAGTFAATADLIRDRVGAS